MKTDTDPVAGLAVDEQESAVAMILTFRLEEEFFALEVSKVNEVLDPIPVTHVPHADPFAQGLLNVRGAIVPLIDIRKRLGMHLPEKTPTSRLIVLDVEISGQLTRLALMVDAVDKVVEARRETIEPIPELGSRWPPEFIQGVIRHDDGLFVLLNAATIFQTTWPAQAA